jgi:hypothetical protein
MSGLTIAMTFWLLATNLFLGAVVLICCALMGWHVLRDLQRQRISRREWAQVPKDYLSSLADLGVALSGTGERIDEMEEV